MKPRPKQGFEVGDNVRICEGPFASFRGIVQEVDNDRSRLKVVVFVYGRTSPAELEYGQVVLL